MKIVAGIAAMLVLLVGGAHVPGASAQQAARPDINLTLTETLKRLTPGPTTRDDLREIPPPRNDKLSDTARVTVIVGSPGCLPGEDGWIVPPSVRRPARSR
jgi:hypothetical protein